MDVKQMEEDGASEEGEILDSDDNYTPLERPLNYAVSQPNQRFPPPVASDSESSKQTSSDSGSDSDKQISKKRPKLKAKPRTPTRLNKHSKYNIWSTHLQEDVLVNTLNTCDVSIKDRSRNVESYDYTLARRNNKRTNRDRNNLKLRLVNKSSEEKDDVRGTPRTLSTLSVTIESDEENIAKDLANKLCEEKEDLILRIVKTAGKQKAIDIFNEVRKIEMEGGMLIMNQSRRRTPGGVYLFLTKHDTELSQKQRSIIFDDEKEKSKSDGKKRKKKKSDKMKEKIAASRKSLPELLTKAELCVQKLVSNNDRSLKKSEHIDVTNPPPTPETDCHENSGDGIDQPSDTNIPISTRQTQEYDDDFLDLGSVNDMDLF